MEILKAAEILDENWLPEYERQRAAIYSQMVGLNTYLFTLERIEDFPFLLFLPMYDDRIFWQTTRNALVETSIIVMWRVGLDADKKALSLINFKETIEKNLQENAKQRFILRLEQVDFDNQIIGLQKRLNNLRNKYFAHFDRKSNVNPDPRRIAEIAVNLDDLKEFFQKLSQLFNVLCLEIHHDLWLWGYGKYPRDNRQTDIDMLLDSVVKNSWRFNLPETDPYIWTEEVSKLSDNDLMTFNQYRLKFGLPAVDRP